MDAKPESTKTPPPPPLHKTARPKIVNVAIPEAYLKAGEKVMLQIQATKSDRASK